MLVPEPAIDLHIPERARLAELVCHQQPDKQSHEEYCCKLRIEVAELMIALNGKKRNHQTQASPQSVGCVEHLDTIKSLDSLILCNHPKCSDADLKLTSLDHFRNHVASIHGVTLRASTNMAKGIRKMLNH